MNKYRILYLIFITVLTSLPLSLMSQNSVSMVVSDGLHNQILKGKIETSISNLLTEINYAQSQKRALSFTNISITTQAQESLALLWENVPFRCIDTEVVEICSQYASEYQIRNVPLMLMPQEGEGAEDEYQEAVISFNGNGQITSFYLTLAGNMYANVMKSGLEVTDLRRRQLILDYVEQFRTAYNMKDIAFLQQVFSDEALIITGNVVQAQKGDGRFAEPRVTYTTYSKAEYLKNLNNIFKTKKYVKVTFSDIKISQAAKKNYYGVLLHQGWSTNTYSDTGYVFLLWDFENEDAPQIYVRTWQPDYLDKAKTQQIDQDDIFSLADFDLP